MKKYFMLVISITTYSFGMEIVLAPEQRMINKQLDDAIAVNDDNIVYGLFKGYKKPNLHVANDEGDYPIHAACRNWPFSEKIINILLNNGAGINSLNKDGLTGLRLVIDASIRVSHRPLAFVQHLILKKRANYDDKDREQRTLLHISALYDEVELLKLFLDYNVNPLAQDSKGRTFLHVAVLRNSINILNLLKTKRNYASLAHYEELKTMSDAKGKKPFEYVNVVDIQEVNIRPEPEHETKITILSIENTADGWSSSSNSEPGDGESTQSGELSNESEDDVEDTYIIKDGGVYKQKAHSI